MFILVVFGGFIFVVGPIFYSSVVSFVSWYSLLLLVVVGFVFCFDCP